MPYGVTPTGFVPKRFEDSRADVIAFLKSKYSNLDTDESTIAGRLIDSFTKEIADLWQAAQGTYNAHYPSTASDASLDNVGDIVSIPRLQSTYSTVIATVYGTEGTSLLTGKIVEVSETGDRFQSTGDITISASNAVDVTVSVDTVVDSTLYTVTIDAINYTYLSDSDATDLEIVAGLVAAITAGTPPGTATDNLDGTFSFIATDLEAPFAISVDANLAIDTIGSPMAMQAQDKGVISALAGSLTEIITPISGWVSVTNILDADEGRERETDAEYRVRRAASLQVLGSSTVEAIRAALLGVDDVTGAFVIENDTDVTDSGGRPPHSFECVIAGGTELDIGNTIWENKPAGIQTYGSESQVITDSQGNAKTIFFSRATNIYLWVRVTLTKYSEEAYPTDGDDLVAAAVLNYGNTLNIGNDVIPQRFIGSIYATPGIEFALVEIATSATPGGPPGTYQTTKLAVDQTEVAVFDSTRIAIL